MEVTTEEYALLLKAMGETPVRLQGGPKLITVAFVLHALEAARKQLRERMLGR